MRKSLFLHAALGGTRKCYFAPEERACAIRSCGNAQSKGDVCSLLDDRMPKGVPVSDLFGCYLLHAGEGIKETGGKSYILRPSVPTGQVC